MLDRKRGGSKEHFRVQEAVITSAKLPGGEYGGIATMMRCGELFVWSDFGHQKFH